MLDDPDVAYTESDGEYCSRLAERLEKFQFELESLAAEFNTLSWRLEDELEPEEDANPFDATKRALYADQPKAKQKMDRSITARDLNMTLESFNRRRNEAQFELARLKMLNAPYCTIYSKDGQWIFRWNFKDATISTMKRPDNGYNLTWKS